jgi:uncharacterized protein with GYD domain
MYLEEKMATYMILMKKTTEGVKQLKYWPDSIDGAIERFEALGGKTIGFYASSVLYDFIGIGEGPDDETAEQFRLLVESWGLLDAQVIRLFTKDEFADLIDGIEIE